MVEINDFKNQLILGDCLEVMPQIPEKSIDLVLADLPFQITSCKWDIMIPFEPLWECYRRVIKPNGAIVLFGSQPFTSLLVVSNLKWFRYEWIWEKNCGSNFATAKIMPFKEHENICVFGKKRLMYNPQRVERSLAGLSRIKYKYSNRKESEHPNFIKDTSVRQEQRLPGSVLKFNRQTGIHSTQKPVPLLSYLIRTYTNPGDLVLDNTMGSGSTIAACLETQRNYIGIEKDPEIYAKAVQRIKNLQPQLSIFDLPA